jgi:colanic acid biosynthesis glycosyl transferase WcaI
MLASGRPVVTTAAEQTQLALAVKDCGLCVPVGDLEAFVAAVVRLATDTKLRTRLGSNARCFAETTLDKAKVLETMEQELLRLTGEQIRATTRPEVSKSEVLT